MKKILAHVHFCINYRATSTQVKAYGMADTGNCNFH